MRNYNKIKHSVTNRGQCKHNHKRERLKNLTNSQSTNVLKLKDDKKFGDINSITSMIESNNNRQN